MNKSHVFRSIEPLIQQKKSADPKLYEAMKHVSDFLSVVGFKFVTLHPSPDPKVYMLPETPKGNVIIFVNGVAQNDTPPLDDVTITDLKVSFRNAPTLTVGKVTGAIVKALYL